jgi:hypothetical protein
LFISHEFHLAIHKSSFIVNKSGLGNQLQFFGKWQIDFGSCDLLGSGFGRTW